MTYEHRPGCMEPTLAHVQSHLHDCLIDPGPLNATTAATAAKWHDRCSTVCRVRPRLDAFNAALPPDSERVPDE
ncbi:hypothetical protein [Nocardia goodfellowii]|uniref:Uncharacterized protein n=1 Tax=Nocardia goodfellowii TaxID=882446 RepID=A0ABS4QG51_9NOCA|nr:hypothetical protein [Nocardia goodfellowii]MBP2190681.1 hypothetical protein [Nocardia goodfellowii]